ncbi:DUF6084 family protein [Streptomyces cinnamoneus]|uniref:DUF6084 family protein n=1 Tax=Streptomyces cinnamoneus TaxID=53446 RepID=UPI003416702F
MSTPPAGPRHPDAPATRDDIADLSFRVTGAHPLDHAAVPTLAFPLRITRTGGGPVRSVSLTTTVRIAAARRRYGPADRIALARLFGQPDQWATGLHPLTWAQITTVVPPFDATTTVDLPVPCSRECELAVTAYFEAVGDTEVPLDFLFSGTVFHTAADGRLRTSRIRWSEETTHALPAGLWHTLTARYFGGTRWLRLSPEAHDRLSAHRTRRALTDWDATIHDLLDHPARHPAGTPAAPDPAGAPWAP